MKKFLFVVLSTLALIGCDDDSSTSSDNDVISPDPVEVNALVSSPTNAEDAGLEEYYGHAINPVPITPHEVPDHPFMSKIKSGLHFDHYNSDVSNNLGPLGEGELDIKTWQISPIVSACPTVMFSEEGDLITVCIEINQTRLFLLDQYTLETKAEFLLPKKQNPGGGDSSGGGYVRMDEQNRVLVNNTDDTIRYIALEKDEDGEYEFVEEKVIDISAKLKNAGLTGYLNDANPDHEGRIWFTLGTGEVGYIGPNEYVLKYHDFGERLQNQTAMDAEGLYVVTSGTTVNPDTGWISKLVTDQYGNLVIDWTSSYDNSGDGVLAKVSGTTPTLFGLNDNYVGIADNARNQLHVNVYDRADGRLVCSEPVFPAGKGGAEDSMIGYQNSLVIANTGGYDSDNPLMTHNGLAKITVNDDGLSCTKDWENLEFKHTAVPALSTKTGMIYTYPIHAGKIDNTTFSYYLAATDWFTGETQFQRYIGSGPQFDDLMQSVTLADDGAFIVTTKNGIVVAREKQ